MRLLSSIVLISLTVIAASCSKNQYAQVEPDDLYFTHKDRKAALGGNTMPSSPIVATVEPTEVPAEYQPERSEYSDQHSPVFATPSYETPTYGSPTIQQYGQKPYYDTSVNPDYLYEEEYADLEGTSSEYYDENYAYQTPPVYETPQVTNNYYAMPMTGFYPTSAWMGLNYYTSFRPFRPYSSYGYDPFGYYYDPFYSHWGPTYSYNPWYDSNYYYGGGYCPGPTTIYGGNYYTNYGSSYSNTSSNNSNTYTEYADGTKVVTKPRSSRNQVSYEVDKTNLPIKSRRADYIPNSEKQSGRVATSGRTTTGEGTVTRSNYTRRSSSPTYYTDNGKTKEVQGSKYQSPATVQKNRTSAQNRTRTVIVPTKTRTSNVNSSTSGQRQRSNANYNANRSSVNRSGSNNRSNGTTRYSTRTTNAKRGSSYGTRSSSNSRTRTSYGTRSSSSRSSGTRSSYSSGRSSSRSSYSAPSRSSGSSSRSVSPSRSSSGSSGTRSSSGRSSSRSSSSRKN